MCSVTPQVPPRSSAHLLPRRSPQARATKASSGQSLEKPTSPLPKDSAGPSPPGEGLPRAGGLLKARPCLHSRVPQSGCGRGTHVGDGEAAGESPLLSHPREGCPRPRPAPRALRAPLCVHLPAGMASFHAIAPTPWLSPPCWAAAAAGTRTRRGLCGAHGAAGLGVAVPRACGAATWTGSRLGPRQQPREPQGRRERAAAGTICKLPALAGPRTARPHLAQTRQRSSSGAQPTRAGWGALFTISSNTHYPTSPTSPRFWTHGSRRQGFRPGTHSKLPALPGAALSQFGTPQPLRGRLQTLNSVGGNFYQPLNSAAQRGKGAR